MEWTHDTPTQEGTYWMRAAPGDEPDLVHLADASGDGTLDLVRPFRDYFEGMPGRAALWAGPLQPPGANPWSTDRPQAAGWWWCWCPQRFGAAVQMVEVVEGSGRLWTHAATFVHEMPDPITPLAGECDAWPDSRWLGPLATPEKPI